MTKYDVAPSERAWTGQCNICPRASDHYKRNGITPLRYWSTLHGEHCHACYMRLRRAAAKNVPAEASKRRRSKRDKDILRLLKANVPQRYIAQIVKCSTWTVERVARGARMEKK